MGESNTTNDARANIHAWFGRAIFQPGARVVVCRTCNTFCDGPNDENIPIVAVLTVIQHLEDSDNDRCELGGTRMEVTGPFISRGDARGDSPWLVCTCECVLYTIPPTTEVRDE